MVVENVRDLELLRMGLEKLTELSSEDFSRSENLKEAIDSQIERKRSAAQLK